MYNDRPVNDPKLQECLEIIQTVLAEYDFAGAVQIGNAQEWVYTYRIATEWNAAYIDENTPLGFRIRAKHDVPGDHEKLEAFAGVVASLKDWGAQCIRVSQDFMLMLKQAGIEVDHTPWPDHGPPPQVIGLDAFRYDQAMGDRGKETRAERRRRQREERRRQQ